MDKSGSRLIKAGDHLFIFIHAKQMYPLKVVIGETFQTKYGPIRHCDLIGIRYGAKLNLSKGWVYVLPFTPELWTMNLPHRTQILYATDISMITCHLNLKPGSIVIESGTGSGSLSHSIIRTISPNGFLYTFDFHLARCNEVRQEFTDHGLSKLVNVENRDVCSNGFGLKEVADALFLDLPRPWDAIPFAHEAMKSNGSRICCFSPCIEQVQKTIQALESFCFMDIETIELVLRPYEIKTVKLDKFNFNLDQDKEKPSFPKDDEDAIVRTSPGRGGEGGGGGGRKMTDQEKEGPSLVVDSESGEGATGGEGEISIGGGKTIKRSADCKVIPTIQIAGHTGFLTFATKI